MPRVLSQNASKKVWLPLLYHPPAPAPTRYLWAPLRSAGAHVVLAGQSQLSSLCHMDRIQSLNHHCGPRWTGATAACHPAPRGQDGTHRSAERRGRSTCWQRSARGSPGGCLSLTPYEHSASTWVCVCVCVLLFGFVLSPALLGTETQNRTILHTARARPEFRYNTKYREGYRTPVGLFRHSLQFSNSYAA